MVYTFTCDAGLSQAELQQRAVHQRLPDHLHALVPQEVLPQIQDLQDPQQRLKHSSSSDLILVETEDFY